MKLTHSPTRPLRADRVVAEFLPFIRHGFAQKLFRKREVKMDGKPVSPETVIPAGRALSVYLPDPRQHFAAITGSSIIAEDDDIIVFDKAAGVSTVEGATTGGASLKSAGERLLVPRMTAVHRLDRDTSGVIVFAKRGVIARQLEDAFRRRDTRKIYHAVVAAEPETASGLIRLPLKKTNQKVVVDERAGLSAETAWRLIGRIPAGWLIECEPRTGRTHQIRVHLARIGCPIVGDVLYGRADPRYRRHLLHASRLTILGRTFEAALPVEFAGASGPGE